MKRKGNQPKPTHQIETVNEVPAVLIVSNDGFIGSYLAQKLLELPLHLVFVSDQELEEIKHLKTNERFTHKTLDKRETLTQVAFPKLNYIFQIVDDQSLNVESGQKGRTRELLQIAKTNAAKFQLVITLDSEKQMRSLVDTHSRETELQGFANDGQAQNDTQNPLEAMVLDYAEQHELDVRIVWLIMAFGPKMPLNNDWEVAKMLRTLHQARQLVVEGEGLTPLYPIFVTDAVSALIKAMFTEGLNGETLLVAGGKEITAVNLAYKLRELMLKKTGEFVEIRFTKTEEDAPSLPSRAALKNLLSHSQENLGWKPSVGVEEGLERTLEWVEQKAKIVYPEPTRVVESLEWALPTTRKAPERKKKEERKTAIPKHEKKKKAPARKKAWTRIGVALVSALLILPITFAITVGSGAFALKKAAAELKKTNLDAAKVTSQIANGSFRAARRELALISKAIPKNRKSVVEDLDGYLEVGQLIAQALRLSSKTITHMALIKDIMLSQSNEEMNQLLITLNGELDSLYAKLSHIEAALNQMNKQQKGLPFSIIDSHISQVSKDVHEVRDLILDARRMLDLAPQLVGIEGRRTYLVLLQNNAELRPTGGFIGSYGLLTFEKGRLLDLVVEDVYVADGQLKGHVEPPQELKKYLGEASWYLRDANWDPDFPTAARRIEWFFEKETGKRVDGTIALNLYVVQEFLRALGPIEIPDYEEEISADNLFETAEYYSEINFFPGSTQKKDFLASLTNNIMISAGQAEIHELIKIVSALSTSLQRGQLLVALHDPLAQQTLNDFGWDGSLREVECPTRLKDQCAKTFIAIREANLGVNKANYFIQRAIAITQNIKKESVETTLTVNYINESLENTWPGGTYKNYMRIYMGEGNKVVKVSVDGNELDSSQVNIKAEHGKTVAGFLITVPIQQERQVRVVMQSKGPKFVSGKSLANWLVQKQPGTENDPLTITITFPQDTKVTSANLPLRIDGRQATLFENFSRDLNLQVEFEKIQ